MTSDFKAFVLQIRIAQSVSSPWLLSINSNLWAILLRIGFRWFGGRSYPRCDW